MKNIIQREQLLNGEIDKDIIYPHEERIRSIKVGEAFVDIDTIDGMRKIPLNRVIAIDQASDLTEYIRIYKVLEWPFFEDRSVSEIKKSIGDIADYVKNRSPLESDEAIDKVVEYGFTEAEANIILDIGLEFERFIEENGEIKAL